MADPYNELFPPQTMSTQPPRMPIQPVVETKVVPKAAQEKAIKNVSVVRYCHTLTVSNEYDTRCSFACPFISPYVQLTVISPEVSMKARVVATEGGVVQLLISTHATSVATLCLEVRANHTVNQPAQSNPMTNSVHVAECSP
jgi:hypothetical protein